MVKVLDIIAQEVGACRKCSLYRTRHNPVAGEGPSNAEIMLVGEAPGSREDLLGRPFVGAAGKVLDVSLRSVGLDRSEVYITNVLKCRPPGNRDPLPTEIERCTLYLNRQIDVIKPRIICPLGNFATSHVLGRYGFKPKSISRIHGRVFMAPGVRVIPMYHPAALIYDRSLGEKNVKDWKAVKDAYAQLPHRGDRLI